MHAILAVLVGVLNFAPGDTGLPYSVLPTAPELRSLGDRLAHDLRAAGTPAQRIPATCDSAECARRVGVERRLDRVVFSSATRHMAMIWTAQANVVDIRTGRVSGPFDIGYKGDYAAISSGLDTLAAAILPAVGNHTAVVHSGQ